ncbi:MAG TPA: hypothetical protein ENJ95_04065 [Bacteroidetes bacterium]|nr:hypothetical protein [Bacteroidota bacterium]
MQTKTIIIGAGLTGLTLGYLLQKEGIPFLVLEARERMGGRIKTLYGEGGASIEMGATWFGKKHRHLNWLLNELGIGHFAQHTAGVSLFETFSFAPPQKFEMPEEGGEPSLRISGGSGILIKKLAVRLGEKAVHLNTAADSVFFKKNNVEINTADGRSFFCEMLVSTLPPRLLAETIKIEPALPRPIKSICQQTHTWMGESIKFSLEYATPFWREKGYSGAAFSQSSIASEIHDHSSEDGTFHALKGFLNPGSASMEKEERKRLLLAQLAKYYGAAAQKYTAYHEAVWSDEKYTYLPYDGYVGAHQNNGHAAFKELLFDGKFRIAGSETASGFPGYMDGAVASAVEVFEQVKSAL